MGKDDSFLARWSRRKREQERELASKHAPQTELESPETAQEDEPEVAPDNLITPEELQRLPRIEDITAGTDIRPFLRHGVPRALRNAALRRKWLTRPSIRDHKDCAVDYAWDWNTPGGVPGDGVIGGESVARLVRTIVGRGASGEAPPKAADRAAPLIHDDVKAEEDNISDASAVAPQPAPPALPVDNAAEGTEIEEKKGEEPRQAHISASRRHGSARPA